jgi:hypothetical protein
MPTLIPALPGKMVLKQTSGPIHPQESTALIPIVLTHPDGKTQTYWISLKRFMEERAKGTPIRRIQRTDYTSPTLPGQQPALWETDFIENLQDFNTAGLKIDDDEYIVEIISEVRVKKNGKSFATYPLKNDKMKIARGIIEKLMGKK